jgi:alanine-glyoxylate transaminase/(R)-3-amino-2-methylpropionate-pyruvate transaminase
LQHATTIYLHPNLPSFAERLVATLPPELDTVYFTNSGSEANDLAAAMARLHTGRDDIVALRGGYHGGVASAMGLTSMSTWKFASQQGGRVHHAINPDPYRSPFSGTPEEIASKSAEDVRDLVRFSTPGEIAAFLAEPIMGAGGVYSGAQNYLREAYEAAREHGGLCIADEVQTGFGRCGTGFWGFETFDVVPDIVTMAKGIGNGLPLAAVVTRREIAETLTRRIHFNTFGGNPVAMAAGEAVLEVIAEERLQERARTLGQRFRRGLLELAERHPLVGDVRGKGLLIGVELVTDRKTKEPAAAAAASVLEHARELGLLIGKGGLWGNVLRIKPSLVLSEEDVDFGLAVLDLAFERASS